MATKHPIPTSPRFQDLTGQTVGRWTVLGYAGRDGYTHKWLCRCQCGVTRAVAYHSLLRGISRSCGCLMRERTVAANTIHGDACVGQKTPEYFAWQARIDRDGWSVKDALTTPSQKPPRKRTVFRGREQWLSEWAAEFGLPYQAVFARLRKYGWTLERALTTPVRHRKTSKRHQRIIR